MLDVSKTTSRAVFNSLMTQLIRQVDAKVRGKEKWGTFGNIIDDGNNDNDNNYSNNNNTYIYIIFLPSFNLITHIQGR